MITATIIVMKVGVLATVFCIGVFSTMTSEAFGQIQDDYPNSEVTTQLEIFGIGDFELVFSGPTTLNRSTVAQDPDGNGLEHVDIEMVSMDLTGTAPIALGGGNISIRAGNDCSTCPQTLGTIEESVNNNPNDVEASEADPAASFFDVFFEIEIDTQQGPMTFHNEDPYCVSSSIADIPPEPIESYVHQTPPVEVFDSNGNLVGLLFAGFHLLDPAQTQQPPRDFPDNLGNPCPITVVGGELLPIDTTALLLTAVQTPAAWLTTVTLASLSIGAYLITRNPNNIRNVKVILRDYLDRF